MTSSVKHHPKFVGHDVALAFFERTLSEKILKEAPGMEGCNRDPGWTLVVGRALVGMAPLVLPQTG